MPRRQQYVYVVIRQDFEHHTDEEGRTHLLSVHKTVTSANDTARVEMLESACVEVDSEGEEIEIEDSYGSAPEHSMVGGLYFGYCHCQEEERDHFQVRVEKMPLWDNAPEPPPMPAPPPAQAKRPVTKKRKAKQVIELSD